MRLTLFIKDMLEYIYWSIQDIQLANKVGNPYTTHMPMLIGLARLTAIKQVVEFGSGQYSTLLFLNRSAFPDLTRLYSFENSDSWIDKVTQMVVGDTRLKLIHVKGLMHTATSVIELSECDLVFIDDSMEIAERFETIRSVTQRYAGTGMVVIHDYERPINRKASKGFKNRFRFTALHPNTGIAWNQAAISKSHLRDLNTLIKQYSQLLQPDDVDGWIGIIDGKLKH